MRAMLAVLICLAAAPLPVRAEPVVPALQSTLAEAARQRLPVLVAFRAPWCYSCYYMERHVHTGPEWEALKKRARVLELDADSPEGAAQMQAWGLRPLPAYVLVDAQGREIGRMLGEQTRSNFFAQIDLWLGPRARLDDLRAIAARGGKKGLAAADAALAAFIAREDADGGLDWFYDLPGPVRRGYEPDAALMTRIARLRLMQAAQFQDPAACSAAAQAVFERELGCERPYEVSRYQSCLGEGARDAVLLGQREPLQRLVEERVFVDAPSCADERSPVRVLAALHQAAGDEPARLRLLDRAISELRRRLGTDLGRDRSAADNLRVYVEDRGDLGAYDALMPRLIATWPQDYVYAFRFGRSLVERDRASEALPYLERAAKSAYGQNRLKVAEQRVKALKRLGRSDDARKVAAEALKANGPWFPEDVAALKGQL